MRRTDFSILPFFLRWVLRLPKSSLNDSKRLVDFFEMDQDVEPIVAR